MKKAIKGWSIFITISLFCFEKTSAQGGLLVTPGRVVFEGTKKVQELNLANNGSDTARYQISFMEIKMNENGTFQQVTTPDSGQFFANKNLRLFPRTILLAPNESQSIKLQLINSNQLTPGEYRSHIYFRAVPDEKPLGENTTVKDGAGIAVRLKPIFGITIPVIIRVGETVANVNISNISLSVGEDRRHQLNMVFNRSGNRSVYGDLRINFISPAGKVTQVGEVNGIAVYTPTPSRKLTVMLDQKAGIDYKSGKIQVIYASADNSPRIAEAELTLF